MSDQSGRPAPVDLVSAIKRLYLRARPATIARDVERAIALLKALPTEEERQQAAVFMDGLSQLRSEWEEAGRAGVPAHSKRSPSRSTR